MPLPAIPRIPAILKAAGWIWPDSHQWDLYNGYALFRREFRLDSLPAKAPLYLTADQSYQLYINGRYVCRGPARGFQHSWPFDEIDVRGWLKKGNNLIAIRAHNPGFGNFQYLCAGVAGLLLAARWGRTRILSGEGWKCRRQAGVRKDSIPTSLQLFCQENIDLNLEDPAWMMPGFDDSSWNERASAKPWNAMPWPALQERGVPMLEEREVSLGAVIGTASGQSAPDHATTRNLSVTRFNEGLAHQPAVQPDGGEVLNFEPSPAGGWTSRLIDLGKLQVGSVVLDIETAQGGEIVECHHYETIDAATLAPDYVPDAHCRMAFSTRLTCRPGRNQHAFYHAFGFRYAIITVRDNPAPLTVRPGLRTAMYPMRIAGGFSSSDEALNAIWNTCAWTQRVCSLDAYVDTPWREQAQWWGDARVQAWNTFHLSGDARLFRRGIRQIATQATPDGVTYGHAPTVAHGCILPDFTLIWMLTLWDHYWQTGSTEAFVEHQPTLLKALDYFESWIDPGTGLLTYDHRYWLFLDWTGLRKDGCSSVYSLWLLHALDRMAELYGITGDHRRATALRKRAAALRKNLQKLVARDGLMRDGYTPAGKIDPETSVHSQALALMTGLVSVPQAKVMVTKRLLPEVTGRSTSAIRPSAYWITYIYDLLIERGHVGEVLADIRERWSPMVAHGTTWENFEPVKGNESFSHAWSAHPLFHLMRMLGGVRQTAPAWTEIVCEPHFAGDHAEVAIPTPRGKIVSAWRRSSSGKINGRLRVPKGVRARLHLPGQKEIIVTGSHRYVVGV
ncbi:MAG: alpha-L-rhamnosidase C-terminal domain-containing protein [Verrucomicrobiota bacterium]